MTDLDSSNWHSHGSAGEQLADGTDYGGGDNINEKHFDHLLNNQKVDKDELIAAIERRVRHLSGGRVIDGLVASSGTNALEVDVSASTGAYVDGQFTESITASTKTLGTNGTTSTRTDTLYVNENGSIGVSEGSTTAPTGSHKIAEVDVSSSDSISAVRNYAHDITHGIASENAPSSPSKGDEWFDSNSNEYNVYDGSTWTPFFIVDGRTPLQGNLDGGANDITNVVNVSVTNQLTAASASLSGSDVFTDFIHDSDNGSVGAGNIAKVGIVGLDDAETLTIKRATLVADDLSAVPTGVDLVIASGSASKATIMSGDGATVFDDVTNDTSYTNSTGAHETLFVGVDNGHYNTGSGTKQDVAADFRGVIN